MEDTFIQRYLSLLAPCSINKITLETLKLLQTQHIENLSWNTLDLFLGRKITLNPAFILEKFLTEQPGGLCYELNGAFCHLLNRLGFKAHLVEAFVHGHNDSVFDFGMKTHVVIIVNIDEKQYLIDVGWGDAYRNPIPLQDSLYFSDISGEYQLHYSTESRKYLLEKFIKEGWRKQYDFSIIPKELHEFNETLKLFYTAKKLAQYRKINCAFPNKEGSFSISDDQVTIRKNNQTSKHSVSSFGGLPSVLKITFKMHEKFIDQYFKGVMEEQITTVIQGVAMKFLINPKELKINNQLIINTTVLKILEERNIKIELEYYDSDPNCSKKDRHTIVYIHGNQASWKVFARQIAHSEKNSRVIAFDLLGHGQSTIISDMDSLSAPEKDQIAAALYNPIAMIAESTQLLKALGIRGAHLVGWALGGCITYGVAVDQPTLVGSVITICSSPIKFSTDGFKRGCGSWLTDVLIPKWINKPERNSLTESHEIATRVGFSGVEAADAIFVANMMQTDPLMKKYFFLNMDQHDEKALDGEQFVKSSKLPICLIIGGEDKGMNNEYIAAFAKQFKNPASRVHTVLGAKNAVFRTHPEEFLAIKDNFIADVTTTSKKSQWSTGQKTVFYTIGFLAITVGLFKVFTGNHKIASTVQSSAQPSAKT